MKHTYIKILVLLLMFAVEATSQENAEIRKIRIRGNNAFSNGELLDKMTFRKYSWIRKILFKTEPSFYSTDAWEMNHDQLKAFYQSEGYLDVKIKEPEIKSHPRKYRVNLIISIDEGKPVNVNQVGFRSKAEGENDSLIQSSDWERFIRKLEVDSGQRFRDDIVNSDQEDIAKWFSSKGYAYAEVVPVISLTDDTAAANINWIIDKGPFCRFGKITIEGMERTPEEAIRKQIVFEEGDVYSSKKLDLSQKYVYDLGLFRIASIQEKRNQEKSDNIPVELTLEEAPRLETRYGVGYGREDKFRTFMDLKYLNFPGKTQRTNFYAKHSGLEPYRFETTVTQPSIFGPRSSLEINPFIRRRSEPGFKSFLWGGNLTVNQNLGDDLAASASLYFERVDIDITSEFERSLSDLSQSTYSKNGVSLGMLYNTARPRFDPKQGWSVAVNTRANSSLFSSSFPFFKYIFEVKRYQPVMNGFVLATRFKAGSITPLGKAVSSPMEERFFAGGSQSIRGWARQMLGPLDEENIPIGGNTIVEGSVEPRIKIYGPVSLVTFLDFGNVWRKENNYQASGIRFAAGTGVRVSTPIGPVGIDFARPVFEELKDWQFHLNIGHAF